MITFRATNPLVLDMIKDKLVDDADTSRDLFINQMRTYMETYPSETFILVHLREEEVMAFLLGYVPPERDFFFIHQAWMDSQLSQDEPDLAKSMFETALDFVRMRRLKDVRFETLRNPKSFIRKYGFKPHSTTMMLKMET